MDFEIIKETKEELEVKIENVTIAELLRVYLNQNDKVKFVAWKRQNHQEPATLRIETSGENPKKSIKTAIKEVTKELERIEKDFSKL
jgi:DNA-directed RNA polymerase subunit L